MSDTSRAERPRNRAGDKRAVVTTHRGIAEQVDLRVTAGGKLTLRYPRSAAVRDMLTKLEGILQLKLSEARATFEHHGNRGSSVEEPIRILLRDHLGGRVVVGEGEVIDSYGARSAQTDVVIANEDHPIRYPKGEPGLYIVEGIAATGEVKAVLNSSELKKALDNSVRVKRLNSIPGGRMVPPLGEPDPHAKKPPSFLFAYSSTLTLATILERVRSYEATRQTRDQILDAVFCLDRGAVINAGDGSAAFKVVVYGQGVARGWVQLDREDILAHFLTWLSISMRRTTPADPILAKYLGPRRVDPPPGLLSRHSPASKRP